MVSVMTVTHNGKDHHFQKEDFENLIAKDGPNHEIRQKLISNNNGLALTLLALSGCQFCSPRPFSLYLRHGFHSEFEDVEANNF